MKVLAPMIGTLVLVLALEIAAEAAILTVCSKGCAHTTIQAAVDDALDGDTILIRPGRYLEQVAIDSKSLTLHGAGPFSTIVDAHRAGRAFSITGEFGVTHVTLAGLAITGGHTNDIGGGIACSTADLTLVEVVVARNVTAGLGGGIYTNCPETTLHRVFVADNSAEGAGAFDGGGGIFAVSGVVLTVTESVITGNHAVTDGGGILGREVSIALSDSLVLSNHARRFGGGLFIDAAGIELTDTVVAKNRADQDGGGLFGRDATVSQLGRTRFIHNRPDDLVCAPCE